ncbi:flavodoxin domain-containing protein [Marinagarivorans algicola]|uniref:flavodoxin domain-containing protein n=1 Tax=Marinagarivorans algicola TaxID=1513270 RepID=UPI0006B610E3|nr:flavodoxin domain-containing protein [Marinagarivorans algicola]
MANIHIVVGSVMGTALMVAEHCSALLSPRHTVRVTQNFIQGQLNSDEVLLVCTSNTGVGDLPQTIAPLFQHLTCDYPAIAGMRYGVINLGDSSYPSFALAGQKLDDALADIGALRLGEPLVIDNASGEDPHVLAADWLQRWEQLL